MEVFSPLHSIRSKKLKAYVRRLPGLVAYYPFWDSTQARNYAPATLNSYNGTVSGGVFQRGKLGGCYSFDGIDDFVNLNSTGVLPNNSGACSIFALINSNNTGTIQNIVGNKRDSTTLGWHLKISSNNRLEFGFYTGDLFGPGNNRSWGDVAGMEVPDEAWCFVGLTFDGLTAKFYINSTEFVRETLANQVDISENTAQNVRIAHRQAAGAGQEFFDGEIQHLGICTTALTTRQMLILAQKSGLA